jgi:hypothetical protein
MFAALYKESCAKKRENARRCAGSSNEELFVLVGAVYRHPVSGKQNLETPPKAGHNV